MSDQASTVKGGVYTSPRNAAAAEATDPTKLHTDPMEANPGTAILDPTRVALRLWQAYGYDPTIGRNINQITEQGVGDSTVKPTLGNEQVQQALDAWWKQNKMDLRVAPEFKQFLIGGEGWHYVPLRADGRIPVRSLTPWQVTEIRGHSFLDWTTAIYRPNLGLTREPESNLTLSPDNTNFFAHDALFGNLRGLTPFATMLFAARRYRRYLDGRERINRLAGIVTGEMKFPDVETAAAVLGWQRDDAGNIKPETVYLPENGTMAIVIGEGSYRLEVPSVSGGGSDDDAQRFYLNLIEGGRLPEYASGNGANVNVATATVQYPFAVRFMLALRDEFEAFMSDTLRLVLKRMVRLGFIADRWTATREDGTTEVETPDTAEIAWSFPEIRELDFEAHFNSIMTLVEKALLADEKAMELLGYDPNEDMPPPEERAARRANPLGLNLGQNGGSGDEEDEKTEALQQALRAVVLQLLARSSRDAPPE